MRQQYYICILSLIALISCVDVIDMELDSSTKRPVIEGYIEQDSYARVYVTQSAAYNDVIDFTPLDADVTLSDSYGNFEQLFLSEDSSCYEGNTITGKEDESYSLNVVIDDSEFDVESHLPVAISFDSIKCEYNKELSELMQMSREFAPSDEESYDSLYTFTLFYQDPPGQDNFYLARIKRYSEFLGEYRLSDDKNRDGEQMVSLLIEEFHLSNTATIFLYSIDEAAYNYYQGLDDLGSSDTPYNPGTNIVSDSDVLGFFSAQYLISTSFVIEDKAVFSLTE